MFHLSHRTFFAAAFVAGLSAAAPAMAQVPAGGPAGVLDCKVAGGVGVVIGSTSALACVHHRIHGRPDFYTGSITHFGFDLGVTGEGHLLFGVTAPVPRPPHYALAGSYTGPLIGLTVGGGTNANGLVNNTGTISLQSLPGSATTGLNATAGLASLVLTPAPIVPPVPYYHHHYHHHYH